MLSFGKSSLLATLILAAPSASRAADEVPQGRLPDDAIPRAYRIDLTVDPDKDRFSGHVEIDVTTKSATRSLWINGRDLHVTSAEARVAGRIIPASYVQVNPQGVAKLTFDRPLPAGGATLAFDYDAPFGNGPAGLYRVQVDGRWYVWSQFETIDARAAYPGFDQPGYKTPFAVTLTTKPGEIAVSNAPEVKAAEVVPGMVRHAFAETRPLPTYLTAFTVGPFASVAGQVAPTPERPEPLPVRIVATQPNRQQMQFALANTGPIVDRLERYFGQPFPFPKLDQIASPAMPGAMENAGADTYPDEVLLLDDHASIGQLQEFGETVSHELSHQWFGDLVTPAWWSDIWLNESFANWMGYRIGNEWRSDLKLDTAAIGKAFDAMNLDALASGRAIAQPTTTNAEIGSAFDPITYGKGGQVVSMIAAYMGDDGFRKGVRLHLARHAYGTATTDQFFQSLSDAAHDPHIAASLRSFVDQPGVPIVRVSRSSDKLTLTQAPYAMLGTTPAARSWIIPFCYSIGGDRNCVLIDKTKMTIPAKGKGPIMPNAGGSGYYRFSLDSQDWRSLIAAAGTLPPGEALAATDSLWASFEAGDAPAGLLVAEARAVLSNPYSAAAADPGARFRSLVKLGVIDPADIPAYRRMIEALYGPKLAAMGFDPKAGAYAGEDADRQKLRAQLVRLVGLDAADPVIEKRLADAAKGWLAGNKDALDRGYSPNAFAAYLAVEGLPAAQRVLERALAGDDPYFRAVAMDTIGRSGNPAIAQWFLDRLDDKRLHASERTRTVRLLLADAATRDLGYRALLSRFDELSKGSFNRGADLMSAPAGFCSIEAAAMIEHDLRPKVAQYETGSLALDRTAEQVRDCGALKQAKGRELANAL